MPVVFAWMALLLAAPAMADDAKEEERLRIEREQLELRERTAELEEQLEEAKRLEALQEEYLEKLKALTEEAN